MSVTTTEPASAYRAHPRDLHVAPHPCAGVNCRSVLYVAVARCTTCTRQGRTA